MNDIKEYEKTTKLMNKAYEEGKIDACNQANIAISLAYNKGLAALDEIEIHINNMLSRSVYKYDSTEGLYRSALNEVLEFIKTKRSE